jgi:hypothetical protein
VYKGGKQRCRIGIYTGGSWRRPRPSKDEEKKKMEN